MNHALAHRLGIRAVTFIGKSPGMDGGPRLGAAMIVVDQRPGRIGFRHVGAYHDGSRWVFQSAGDAFAFEDVASYTKRTVKDRINFSLLRQYAGEFRLSVDVRNDCGPCYVIRDRESGERGGGNKGMLTDAHDIVEAACKVVPEIKAVTLITRRKS